MFDGLNETVRGASHEESGTVCQDFSAFEINENYAIAITADGHGSKKHFRSDVGSRLATEVTLRAVSEFSQDFEKFRQNMKRDSASLIKKIEKYIIEAWDKEILKYHKAHPITDEEIERVNDEKAIKTKKVEAIYGTTLITAVMCEDFCYGFQIGDGSCVVINENGEFEMPIVDDESHPANLTSSLCNSNAVDMFEMFYKDTKQTAVIVSTDGLFTSFASRSEFETYNRIVTTMLDNTEEAGKSIRANLMKRAKYGSQDDISISVVFDTDMQKKLQISMNETIKANQKKNEMEDFRQRQKLKKQMAKRKYETKTE